MRAFVADELLGPGLPTRDRGVARGEDLRRACAPAGGGPHGSSVWSANTVALAGARGRVARAAPRRRARCGASVDTATAIGPPRVRQVPGSVVAHERRGEPELGPDRDLDVELDAALGALDDPDEPGGRVQADVVVAVVGMQRHEVGEDARRPTRSGTGSRGPSCPRCTRAWPRPASTGRIDQKPPGSPRMRAKSAGESKLGQAGPVDGPGAAHQRAALAVAEQRIVRDGRRPVVDRRPAVHADPERTSPSRTPARPRAL